MPDDSDVRIAGFDEELQDIEDSRITVEERRRKVQGGFSMSWNHGQVTFVSVRGAGHLLPLYRPAASYTMMHSYQTGEALPPTFWP